MKVQTPSQHDQDRDQDLEKGAVEGPPDGDAHGNTNAPGLNAEGLPDDELAICEDVIGANEDETQG